MKKLIIFLTVFVIILVSLNVKEDLIIPDESIRIRVIGHSNNQKDQMIKQLVRNKIEIVVMDLLKDTQSIDEARDIIENNIGFINNNVKLVLKENNYNREYKINFGYNFFPEKKYKGVIYKKGYYESIVITLGDGNGDNWWCVLFPPLCLMETEESNLEEVEYKSFIMEIINKYF